MSKLTPKRKKIVAFTGFSIIIFFLGGSIFIADQLLLKSMLKRRDEYLTRHKLALALDLENKPKLSANISKTNYGKYIKEGSLTKHFKGPLDVTEAVRRGAHHDNPKEDYLDFSSGKNNIWIFGDSWGKGIRENEKDLRTISRNLSGKFAKLRIFANGSWSPLLMNLAARHRSKIYNESPDLVVLFLDQTDIGDDYCRYRPFVERDDEGHLLRVNLNFNSRERERGQRLMDHIVFGDPKSGFKFAFMRILYDYFFQIDYGIAGFNSCKYNDLLAWQLGYDYSPNGSLVNDYEKYFKFTVLDLIKELEIINPNVQILLVSHDWVQMGFHNIDIPNNNKFKKSISLITSHISDLKDNIFSLNVKNSNYYDYTGPKNFNHLKSYNELSNSISDQLKTLIN